MSAPVIVIWGFMGPLLLMSMIGIIYIFYFEKKNKKKRRRQ